MADIEIRQDFTALGPEGNAAFANVINIRGPLTAEVNTTSGIGSIGANTSKITDLPSISDAIGNDVLVIVTNASSIPVTERISVADLFGNVQANVEFSQNTTFKSNVYVVNLSIIQVGNDTVNAVMAPGYLSVSNTSGIANVQAGVFVVGNTSINSTIIALGSNVITNSSSISIGNSSVNTVINSTATKTANSTSSITSTSGYVSVGNSTINLVANSSALKISNTLSNTTIPIANSTQYANNQYYLNANGSWSIVSGVVAIPGGANTNIQYNSSDTIAGSNAFNFDNSTNTVSIANGGKLVIGNSSVNVVANSSTFYVGANVFVNSSAMFSGNSTANLVVSKTLITIANSTGTANVSPTALNIGTSVVNATTVASGANVTVTVNGLNIEGSASQGNSFINAEAIFVGNSLISTSISKLAIDVGSDTVNAVINSSSFTLANSTVNVSIVLPTALQYGATNVFLASNGAWTTVQPVAAISGSNQQVQFSEDGALAGSNGFLFEPSTNTISIGNTTLLFTANSTTLKVGNTTDYALVNATALRLVNSTSNASISVPTATQKSNASVFLHANGSWVDINTGGVIVPSDPVGKGSNTHIQFNDSTYANGSAGFTFNKTTNNVTISNTLTVANLYVNTGRILVGNSTVNSAINATAITLANSSVNTRIIIPTAAQYANTTTFLHANGSWVDMSSVIQVPAGVNGSLQYNLSGTLTGNGQISISGNNSIVLANSTSNTRLSIPTTTERGDGETVLHANGSWVKVRRVLKIRYDGWFFGRSPQFYYNKNWTFIPNSTFSATASNWTTVAQGSIRVDGDTDGAPGSTVATVVEASAHMYGAFYRTYNGEWPGWYPVWGTHHEFFDNYWWWWNDYDSEVEFRILLNSSITSDVLTRVTTLYRKHIPTGTLAYTFTELGEGYYDAKLQARLVYPNSDPAVSIRARKIKATQ